MYIFVNNNIVFKGVFTKKANKRYERKPLTAWSALDAELDPTDEMNRVEK